MSGYTVYNTLLDVAAAGASVLTKQSASAYALPVQSVYIVPCYALLISSTAWMLP
jgi:hypothetical protein